jgi:hypothetical protein
MRRQRALARRAGMRRRCTVQSIHGAPATQTSLWVYEHHGIHAEAAAPMRATLMDAMNLDSLNIAPL